MDIEVKKEGATLYIAPKGRIDSFSSSELEEKIRNSFDDTISLLRIDMQNVDFISSKGIRVLLSLHREMSARGKMVLANINNSVREVLHLSALLEVFSIE